VVNCVQFLDRRPRVTKGKKVLLCAAIEKDAEQVVFVAQKFLQRFVRGAL